MKSPAVWTAFLILLMSVPLRAAGPHGIQPGQPLSDSGVVILDDQVAQALADTGAGFVRVNFRLGNYPSDTTAWYAAYDGIVDRLRSRGLEVIGLMTNEARPWAPQTDWSANSYEAAGGDGWNTYLSGWCDAFKRFATHWNGKIRYWELWNEPDCLAVIYPSNFGALLAHAYDLAHTNNLNVEIISGGVCGPGCTVCGPDFISQTYDVSINHTGWFTQMKNRWGTYPLDHIGFHIYPFCNGTLSTSWLSSYFDTVRNSYATYEGANTTKKLWLTEIGWMTGGGCLVSEATQAANLTSAYNVANSKSFVKCVTWFFLKDEPSAGLYYGVYRSTGLTESDKKPAWTSLKTSCTFEGRWSSGGSVNQPILDYFSARGHAVMGNPCNFGSGAWVRNWDYGPVQDYDDGDLGRMIVCDSSRGVGYAIRGNFIAPAQSSHSVLEFPLGDQIFTGIDDRQEFEGGCVTWTQAGGAQVIPYATKTVLDNSDAGFGASTNWVARTASDAWNGGYRRRTATTSNADPAVWTITVPSSGYYDVYARWPAVTGASTASTYEVVHTAGTASVVMDQSARAARWNRLGRWQLGAGSAVVRLSSQGSTGAYVLADAVRLAGPVLHSGVDTTPPSTPVVTDDGQYQPSTSSLHATWESQDMESGIDRYEYAIGISPTDPGSGYTVGWTSTGTAKSVTRSVALSQGVTYYFYVRAHNLLGMVSSGVSDGIRVDATGPSRPTVTDDGDFTGDTTQLHCTWISADSASGISAYEYSIGTSAYGSNVIPATNVGTATSVLRTGLSLAPGTTYYFTVRARNGAGIWSAYGTSDGILCRSATRVSTIVEALALPDSTVVVLTGKPVSATFFDRFYLSEPDNLRGIAVLSSRLVTEGSPVDVSGTLCSSAGERRIVPGCITPQP